MHPKILLIDDDRPFLLQLEALLKGEGYEVATARNGLEGLRTSFDLHPDLVIVDVMMPKMNGLEVTRRLRELADIPVIVLTGHPCTADIVKSLAIGADDYITKPFNKDELLARIQHSLRRRSAPSSPAKGPLALATDIVIDSAQHRVMIGDRVIHLTPTEFQLLSYLARNRGRVIPHRTLLMEIWGPEYSNEIEYLHLYIRYLRRKIERDPSHPEIIMTERNVGYYIQD